MRAPERLRRQSERPTISLVREAPEPPLPLHHARAQKRFTDILLVLGRSLLLIGVLSLLFGFFQVGIADISERRSQRELTGAFNDLLRSGAPLGATPTGEQKGIPVGRPVALLEIPSLGVRKIVVEGTGAEELKRGPGHLRTSSVPGQPGHAIIVGRRTTYGSPFRRLELLRQGDLIFTTTPYGRFTFKVRKVARLAPGKATRLTPATEGLLTLATSDPPYRPNAALVVDTELSSPASTFTDPPRPKGLDGAVDFRGNVASMIGVAISGTLLFAALALAQVLYRRWRRWPTYLITTPIILALLFAWMEGIISTLPSTL